MEVNDVIAKILADAQTEAEKITGQSSEKVSEEKAGFQKQLTVYNQQTEQLAAKAAEEKKATMLASARMATGQKTLEVKRKIIDKVFAKARELLLSMPDDKYKRLMADLMIKSVQTGSEEVVVDTNEKHISQDFINEVNAKLAANSKGNLRLCSERQNIGAGFVLKRGKIKQNVSLDVLIGQARDKMEINLAKELFE